MVDMYKKLLVNQLDENGEEPAEAAGETGEAEGKEWKSGLTLNPDIQEYGEKQAEIIDIAVVDEEGRITNVLEKGSTFTVKMKVRINSELNDPIFALTIKNLQGTDVTGTNTFYEGVDTGTVAAGEERIITFKQKLDLQGGDYLLSFGCTGYIAGEFHVFHRLYDFCNLTVVSNKNTVGFYDMNSEVHVIKG